MKRALITLVVLLLAGGAATYAWLQWSKPADQQAASGGRRGRGGRGDGPVSVVTEAARRTDMPVTLEAVGTVQATNTVTVRSQVDGRLLELAFREGQDVRKGDVLARIDPTIYQAQYDGAVAKKAQDDATLANARLDLARYINLAATNYGSKQQADTQRATVAQLEAQVKSDQATIDNARAYLDYTTVPAPIDGRTGIRAVDAGNIVRAADLTGIVTITQLRPITVVFNLPQQNLGAVIRASARGAVAVTALESDNRTQLDAGTLEVIDNQVDATTGTVKLKASFANQNLQLWPGAFVNVSLTVDILKDAVVVPTGSVQRGPTGTFVYGVSDDKAVVKPVTVTRQTETLSVIASGLVPPERVITTGFARLTEGDPVRISEPNPRALEAAPTPRRRRPDGEAALPRDGAPRDRARPDATGSAATPAPAGDNPETPRRREGGRRSGEAEGRSGAGSGRPGGAPP